MPECPSCQQATQRQITGRYNVDCIACMARMIVNARPSKAVQERQIAYLKRHHKGAWPELWSQIQNQLKQPRTTNAPKVP